MDSYEYFCHDNDLREEVVVQTDRNNESIMDWEPPNGGLMETPDFVILEFLPEHEQILGLLLSLIFRQVEHEHNFFNEVVLIQMMDLQVYVTQGFITDQNVVSMLIHM